MYDSEGDSSDSEIVIMKKCLDVELPPDFDPTKPPETGEEYVQYVMYERKMCKKWVVAENINKTELEKNQTFYVTVNEGCVKAPDSMLPTEEWQLEQLEKFSEFRKFITPSVPETPDGEKLQNFHKDLN
ncbi:gem-associated protein 2 isoform X2 [Agrilus planipennis]|uniref:Gem-associated protein 2 isoform X2 n=1 Tax=Agrilus planipennis TaxID=224129 RepID=A0A1W4WM42_AGRPL|nr:gem-associated protein 2 isoform X2 [Agrilus planipennis]